MAELPDYQWIDTPQALEGILPHLRETRRIAVDIEADSLYHYFHKVCLLQISSDQQTFLLDPLALRDFSELAPLMADPRVEKVFHAASYDVYCLRRDFGFGFACLFDTHLAAQLLGYEQIGLSALLERLLGVAHSKVNQRDDWSRRPLKQGQLEYAARDTHHLLELRDILEDRLREKNRLGWAQEEFENAAAAVVEERDFDPEGFRHIKGSRQLSLPELAVLRALYLLREKCARQLDLPPFKVLNNSALMDLSRRPPLSAQALFKRPGISVRVARLFGDIILEAIETAKYQDPAFLIQDPPKPWKAAPIQTRLRLERLKSWRLQKARDLGLSVGVVFPNALLDDLAAFPPESLPELAARNGVRRWRAAEFGAELMPLFSLP